MQNSKKTRVFGLICTTQQGGALLERLLLSIDFSICKLYLVSQGCEAKLDFLADFGQADIQIIQSEKTSLSKARNLALEYFENSHEFILFPDDDCWYPPNFFSSVRKKFEQDNKIYAVSVSVYDPCREVYYRKPKKRTTEINFSNVLTVPLSVSVICKFDNFMKNYRFHEEFGVGARFGSGEETLLYASLLQNGMKIIHDWKIKVFHEIPDIQNLDKIYSYSVGFGKVVKYIAPASPKLVSIALITVIFKTAIAAIISIGRPNSKIYKTRLKGILKGVST